MPSYKKTLVCSRRAAGEHGGPPDGRLEDRWILHEGVGAVARPLGACMRGKEPTEEGRGSCIKRGSRISCTDEADQERGRYWPGLRLVVRREGLQGCWRLQLQRRQGCRSHGRAYRIGRAQERRLEEATRWPCYRESARWLVIQGYAGEAEGGHGLHPEGVGKPRRAAAHRVANGAAWGEKKIRGSELRKGLGL
ncbi:hypothetical protein GOP47_0004681 [Adiantum capillus-veneris]|uniref:Uncharacterized protein n=1 Tax=Adiantum capillus-veneris TaxID=13818 RepID=A0A9D4V9B4_ADICA|nr:hypothetical protein GOP47_0004681 [Adiantum capillus-veneris]